MSRCVQCDLTSYSSESSMYSKAYALANKAYFKQSLFASLSEVNNTAENSQPSFMQQYNVRFLE